MPVGCPLSGFVGRALMAAVIAAAFLFAAPTTASAQDLPSAKPRKIAAPQASLSVGAAAAMISKYRRSHGLPAVQIDSRLMAVARQQTRAMVMHDRLSHDAGGDFGTRLRSAGYPAAAAAENIAAGQRSLAEAFSGWVASPGHRSNLLLGGATRIGVAAMAAPRSKYGTYWTLVIAAPAVAARHRSARHRAARHHPPDDEFKDRSRAGEQ
jgi:uncharacterized protein YkwD